MIKEALIRRIIDETGTPAYIYDGDLMKNSASRIFEVFNGLNPHFSFKANPNIELARKLLEAGFGAEVSSEFEARTALEAGFKPENIMYDGPAKTSGEIFHALSCGITHFNIESRAEAGRLLQELGKFDRPIPLSACLRVNPQEASSAAEVMTGESSRFGIDEEVLEDQAKAVISDGLKINGLHLYVGSQILDHTRILENFKKGLLILANLAEKGLISPSGPAVLVFGPGLGVDYSREDNSQCPPEIGKECIAAAEAFKRKHGRMVIKTEIGRALVARSGLYVTRVVETKISRGKLYILVDGGIHHFMRYAMTGTKHRAVLLGAKRGAKEPAVIGGATCTPYDILTVADIERPDAGDLIAIADAGAYGWSMGLMNFLSRPSPPEVISENGEFRVIREKGKFEDLLKSAA